MERGRAHNHEQGHADFMRLDHVTYFHNAIITEVPQLKECFLRKALGHKGTTFIFSQTHRYLFLAKSKCYSL